MELQLRIIFLIIGMLILFGVTVDFIRRRQIKQGPTAGFEHGGEDVADEQLLRSATLQEPDLDSGIEHGLDLYGEYVEPEAEANLALDLDMAQEYEVEKTPVQLPVSELLVIYIMARDPIGFKGNQLIDALANAKLHIGKNDIYYRYEQEDGAGEALFNVASAVEPGYFNLDTLRYETIPGITLIMLPAKVQNPLVVLDKLIRTAKQLSFALNGELLDHARQPLTLTTIDNYKEQIQNKK